MLIQHIIHFIMILLMIIPLSGCNTTKSGQFSTSEDYTNSNSSWSNYNNTSIKENNNKDYIEKYVELIDGDVQYSEGYLESGPGLQNVEVKNNGDRTINSVIVTVYFLDTNNQPIAENSIMVIGGYSSKYSLKPNYSWRMKDGTFYLLENLPSIVDITNYRLEISKIEFQD